ncbi:MAG: hypothetical protein ACFFDP_03295 [Promethearchaeota archaeon]
MARQLVMLKIVDTGETEQITDGAPAKTHMKSEAVLIIIDDDERKIWIWKGDKAPVRRKFIAARRAAGIRDQRGLTYKIISQDHGQEDSEFIEAVGLPSTTKVDEAATIPVECPDRQPPPPREIPPEPTTPKAPKEPTTAPDYTRVVLSATRTPRRQPVQVPHPPSEIIQEVEQLTPVPGYRREFVLVGFDAFAITEEITTVLGKRTVNRRLQRLDSLPEGTIFAQGYTPRVVIRDGQVLAIEFLKELEEKEYQHEKPAVKEEIRQQLTDLIQTSPKGKRKQTKT